MSHIWCLLHVIACISLQYYINLQFCRASLMYTYENAIKYVFEILNINLEIRSTSLSRIRWISIFYFELIPSRAPGFTPGFGGVRVALHFSVLCCVVFVYVLCLVCPMLSVFLNSPFLIAASVFSNILFYLLT